MRLDGHVCTVYGVADTLRSVCVTYFRLDEHFYVVHAVEDTLNEMRR